MAHHNFLSMGRLHKGFVLNMTGLSKIKGNRPLPSRRLLPRQSGCHSRMRSHGIPLRSPASVLLLFFLSSSFCRVVKNKKTISNRKRSTSTAKMRENAPVSQYADFACNLCVHVPEHFSLIFAKLAIPQNFSTHFPEMFLFLSMLFLFL